jgi:hypothetical protein
MTEGTEYQDRNRLLTGLRVFGLREMRTKATERWNF